MRSFGFRLTALGAILWAGIGSTVWALGYRGDPIETVYVMPSSVTLPVPTSYVVSTSWVEPTAYAVPTYYTTAYWMDPVVLAQPAYAPTAYVRRGGLFGRRWVVERPVLATYTTPYVPTAYYAAPRYRATSYALADPVIVPSAYVASADCVCPPVVASAAPLYPSPSSRGAGSGTGTGTRPRIRQSEPDDRSSTRSDVGPPPDELNALGSTGATGENSTTARETAPGNLPDFPQTIRDTTPPPPAAQRPPAQATRPEATAPQGRATSSGTGSGSGQSGTGSAGTGGAVQPGGAAPNSRIGTTPRSSGANTGGGNPGVTGSGTGGNTGAGNETGTTQAPTAPTAPADSDLGAPPSLGSPGETRHESMRPSNYGTRPVRSALYNVLVGTVVSDADHEPEEGVRISVRNTATGSGKETTTNAFGRFAVRLADGDWTVDVTTRSGRVYEVSQIRVSNGSITDTLGRRVPSLEITR